MVLTVWAFSLATGIFGFEEEVSACGASSQDRQAGWWSRCQRRMENIRDSVFEGWMANRAKGTTSRKGEGPGKKSGGAASGGSGSGEDSSWGKEASKLCKEIKKDLREAGPKDATEAVAGGSGVQRPVDEGVMDERAEDTSSSDDEDEDDGSNEGETGSSEVKVVNEVRKDGIMEEKRVKGIERMGERREGERDREWRRRMARSGSASYGRNWEAGVRPKSRSRSRKRQSSESMFRGEAGRFARPRKVFTDGVGCTVAVDNFPRDREVG